MWQAPSHIHADKPAPAHSDLENKSQDVVPLHCSMTRLQSEGHGHTRTLTTHSESNIIILLLLTYDQKLFSQQKKVSDLSRLPNQRSVD